MNPLLISPPALEPVSLIEAKLYLKIDHVDEDDLLRSLITASRLLIEAASGRLLIHQTWRLVLDRWRVSGTIRCPLSPVAQVVAVRVLDAGGLPSPVPVGALALETGADPPLLRINAAVPMPMRAQAGIEIDLLAGFGAAAGDVPASLRQAVLMLVARFHEHRGDTQSMGTGAGEARLPPDVLALIAPHRRARL